MFHFGNVQGFPPKPEHFILRKIELNTKNESELTMTIVFFFRENQKCPWKPFLANFSSFFTDRKVVFTHTFSQLFTGSPTFSRTLDGIFSRVGFIFHGKKIEFFQEFSRMGFFSRGENLKKFLEGLFFSRRESWTS